MSTGPRLQLAQADRVVAALFQRWKLDPKSSFVVGSVRRRKPDVGDIELVCPAMPRGNDQICKAIESTMATETMFAAAVDPDQTIGRAIKGLKPGFLAASLILRPFDHDIPCQIYRYTARNFGWVMLCRTGPAEFGAWFLSRWKSQWRIPVGDLQHQASVDGNLVDRDRNVIDTPTESEAFRLCGLKFIEPQQRDAFIAHQLAVEGKR